jgi:hypothetical protein
MLCAIHGTEERNYSVLRLTKLTLDVHHHLNKTENQQQSLLAEKIAQPWGQEGDILSFSFVFHVSHPLLKNK